MEIKIKAFKHIRYIIQYPEGYREGARYPVILFLHGSGGRYEKLERMVQCGYLEATQKYTKNPFITVMPHCVANTWFDMFEQLKEFLCGVATADFADDKRIYVMGASMGGYATWQLGMSMPDTVAAMVPICGGGMYWNAARLKNVPVWAFHGAKDDVVALAESQKMVDAVNQNGGNAKLTVYPNCAHDAWTDTFNNQEVFDWLLRHTNSNANALNDAFTSSKIYG